MIFFYWMMNLVCQIDCSGMTHFSLKTTHPSKKCTISTPLYDHWTWTLFQESKNKKKTWIKTNYFLREFDPFKLLTPKEVWIPCQHTWQIEKFGVFGTLIKIDNLFQLLCFWFSANLFENLIMVFILLMSSFLFLFLKCLIGTF